MKTIPQQNCFDKPDIKGDIQLREYCGGSVGCQKRGGEISKYHPFKGRLITYEEPFNIMKQDHCRGMYLPPSTPGEEILN